MGRSRRRRLGGCVGGWRRRGHGGARLAASVQMRHAVCPNRKGCDGVRPLSRSLATSTLVYRAYKTYPFSVVVSRCGEGGVMTSTMFASGRPRVSPVSLFRQDAAVSGQGLIASDLSGRNASVRAELRFAWRTTASPLSERALELLGSDFTQRRSCMDRKDAASARPNICKASAFFRGNLGETFCRRTRHFKSINRARQVSVDLFR